MRTQRDFGPNVDSRREKKGLYMFCYRIKEFDTNEVQFREITLYTIYTIENPPATERGLEQK